MPRYRRAAGRVEGVAEGAQGHSVARAGQVWQLRPALPLDLVGLNGVRSARRALSPDRDHTPAGVSRAHAPGGRRHGLELRPAVALRVIPLERPQVRVRRQLASADGVQVAAIGGGAEMLTRGGNIGTVLPALAVEPLGLADELAVRLSADD